MLVTKRIRCIWTDCVNNSSSPSGEWDMTFLLYRRNRVHYLILVLIYSVSDAFTIITFGIHSTGSKHVIVSNLNGIYLDQTALFNKMDWDEVMLRHWNEVNSLLALLVTEGWISMSRTCKHSCGEDASVAATALWASDLPLFTWQELVTQPGNVRFKGCDHMIWRRVKEFSCLLCPIWLWTHHVSMVIQII